MIVLDASPRVARAGADDLTDVQIPLDAPAQFRGVAEPVLVDPRNDGPREGAGDAVRGRLDEGADGRRPIVFEKVGEPVPVHIQEAASIRRAASEHATPHGDRENAWNATADRGAGPTEGVVAARQ